MGGTTSFFYPLNVCVWFPLGSNQLWINNISTTWASYKQTSGLRVSEKGTIPKSFLKSFWKRWNEITVILKRAGIFMKQDRSQRIYCITDVVSCGLPKWEEVQLEEGLWYKAMKWIHPSWWRQHYHRKTVQSPILVDKLSLLEETSPPYPNEFKKEGRSNLTSLGLSCFQ